jgi:DNA topoisomerase-3
MKENGIGRPSSRAWYHRDAVQAPLHRREAQELVATPTGMQLIDTIRERLLTSCELTGIWEKKLRDIEHHKYDPALFVSELKRRWPR